jgi:hypothetical protein
MYARFFYLCMVALLNICYVNGQAIQYDYDSNGNRTQKCIVLNKSAHINANTDNKYSTAEYKETLEEMTVKIYPNPTDGNLFVELSGITPDGCVDYQVISQTGNILEMKHKAGTTFNIDFDQYQKGVCFLILSIGNERSQWKIVKK